MNGYRGLACGTLLIAMLNTPAARADCPSPDDPIVTDRPSVANSSSAVPEGSLQFENGISFDGEREGTIFDLPETRARLGVTACTEFLVDLPDYTRAERTGGVDGVTNIGPAIKHQFQGLPDGLTLSGTIGTFLGTGDKAIAGRGPAPYAQLPWSYDLGQNWSINGMYSATFHPRDPDTNPSLQTSVYLDRTVSDKSDVFVEYINDYQGGAATLNRFDVGATYRFSPTRQVDLKLGAGVNSASPDWYVTVGYSFRFDRLL